MAVKTNYSINGKNYFRVSASFGRDSNGKLIRKYFYGKSEKEAKKKLEEYKESLKRGLVVDKNLYLSPIMEQWLYEIVRNKIKASTFDRYEDIFRNYFKASSLSYKLIKDIKSIDIQKYYNDLYKSGKSYSRIKSINKILNYFLNYCFAEGYILRNPCLNITIPGKNNFTSKEVEVFSRDELRTIIQSNDKALIRLIAIVSFSTGMRIGEVLGLSWNDIDYKENQIHINKIVACYTEIYGDIRKKVKVIQAPKTKSSIRTIPLPTTLIPVFEEVKRTQNINKLKCGSSYKKEYKNQIFLTEDGNLIYPTNLTHSWKLLLKRLDIPYKKFHSLRHTYATMQFEANIPLKTVSVLLGHASIDITADTYTHVLKKEKNKSADIISVLKMC